MRSDEKINKIWSVNEWGKLKEIIVGRPHGAFVPDFTDISRMNFERTNFDEPYPYEELRKVLARHRMPQRIIDETEEDLQELIRVLKEYGVIVHLASDADFSQPIKSNLWEAQQEAGINIRDLTLIHGNVVIEAPSGNRGRYFEDFVLRDLFDDYRQRDQAAWFVAPHRPRLRDETYDLTQPVGLNETEPIFDAANCLRLGKHLLIDINNSANHAGADWIQQTINKHYGKGRIRLHKVRYFTDHIDVIVLPLREGTFLLNPLYVNQDKLPEELQNWDVIYSPEMIPQEYHNEVPKASNCIGLNLLVLDGEERTVIVEKSQTPLIRTLEENKFRVIPVTWRHGRTWGGAFHCVTLDLHREGELD